MVCFLRATGVVPILATGCVKSYIHVCNLFSTPNVYMYVTNRTTLPSIKLEGRGLDSG